MSLVDKVKNHFRLRTAKKNMDELLSRHQDIILEVETHGKYPRVYLFGENHTEASHTELVTEAMRTVYPDVLLWEGAGEDNLEQALITLEDYILKYANQNSVDAINKYFTESTVNEFIDHRISFIKEMAEKYGGDSSRELANEENKRQHYLNFIEQIIDSKSKVTDITPLNLSIEDNTLLEYTLTKAIQEELNDLQTLISDMIENTSYDEYEHIGVTLEDLYSVDLFYQLSRFEDYKEVKEILTKLSLEHHITEKVYGHLETKFLLSQMFSSDRYFRESAEQSSHFNIARNGEVYTMLLTARETGTYVNNFDDNDVKRESIKNEQISGNASRLREVSMREILAKSLEKNELIFTYTGRDHVTGKNPITNYLRDNNIPHTIIRLTEKDKNYLINGLKSILYSDRLRESS